MSTSTKAREKFVEASVIARRVGEAVLCPDCVVEQGPEYVEVKPCPKHEIGLQRIPIRRAASARRLAGNAIAESARKSEAE